MLPLIRTCSSLVVACLFASFTHAVEPALFTKNSLKQIEASYAGQPFLISVWSLDCTPCFRELQMLGEIKRENPDFNLVLISTDAPERAEEVELFLNKFQLAQANSWIYSSTETERLSYSLDSQWYGEMPRTYFYNPQGEREAVSGLLPERVLREWMQ